jgi:hypothetical protein
VQLAGAALRGTGHPAEIFRYGRHSPEALNGLNAVFSQLQFDIGARGPWSDSPLLQTPAQLLRGL